MKIFASYDNSVILQCQYYYGCLPVKQQTDIRRLAFLLRLQQNKDLILAPFVTSIRAEITSILKTYKCSVNDSLNSVKDKIWVDFEKLSLGET